MPDFERLTRSLERHLAQGDELRLSYLRGRYEGLNKARREIAWIAVVVVLVVAGATLLAR